MRISVTSQNFRTITPHAGVTRRFLVYEGERGGPPREVDRLDLPKELAFREFARQGQHPLDNVDAVIVGSAGPGFIRRLAARGVQVIVTSETDPLTAVTKYFAGTLTPGEPNETANSSDCYGVRVRARRRQRRDCQTEQ
jgi:predicted Fe-Mo cluster-binding NifX family protein